MLCSAGLSAGPAAQRRRSGDWLPQAAHCYRLRPPQFQPARPRNLPPHSPLPPIRVQIMRAVSKDTKEETMKVFKLFDVDSTGKITLNNLKKVAKELGESMSDEELQDMIE